MTDEIAETVAEEPKDDLRAALRAAAEEVKGGEAPAVETAGTVTDDLGKEADPLAVETPAETGDRKRGPNGRFIRADGTEEPEAAPKVEIPDPLAKIEAAPVKTGVEAPTNWKAEHREMFGKLPAEGQSFLLDRHREMEADYTRKTQENAELKRDWEPVKQYFATFSDQMRATGATPLSVITAWGTVEQRLRNPTDRAQTVIDIMNGYGVPVQELGQRLASAQAGAKPTIPDDIDPALRPLYEELHALKESQAQREARETKERETAQNQQRQGLVKQITDWASETGSDGQPLRPHFGTVSDTMNVLLQAATARGERPTLQQLYEQAVRANPTTFAEMSAAQEVAREAAAKAQQDKANEVARAKAAAARRTGSSVTGGPGPGQTKQLPEKGDLRSAIKAAFQEHTAP